MFLPIIYNFYMFFTFMLVYVSLFVFVCARVCGCTVVCELQYLNVCLRDLQAMRAHRFLNFIFDVIREKDELYILSLDSVSSIKNPTNLLKLVCHPLSCLLHHYVNL